MKAKTIINRGIIYNKERKRIWRTYEKLFNKPTLVNQGCGACVQEILKTIYKQQELNSIFE